MRPKPLLALSVLAVASLVITAAAAAKSAPTSFTTFELAATPPSASGTVCPGNPLCWNGAAEPAIRATAAGRFFASSENGLGSGTLAWTSGDGGLHYASTPSPNDVSTGSDSRSATRCISGVVVP